MDDWKVKARVVVKLKREANMFVSLYFVWTIIVSDRQPEAKQGIEGKLLGSDREGLGLGIIDRRCDADSRSEAINFRAC